MAEINRKIVREKPVRWKREHNDIETHSEDFYNTQAWKRLRRTYLSLHPICEECLRHERITPAAHVHHLRPFMSEKTDEARWNTFLNESNLRSLCECCHWGYHYKMRHKRTLVVDSLGDDEYSQAQLMYGHNVNEH